MQGDLIEGCPVSVFQEARELAGATNLEQLLEILQRSVGIQSVRVIIMTQACDLAQDKVRNVILCPVYSLEEHKANVEKALGRPLGRRDWESQLKQIRDGKIWNLTLLERRNPPEGGGLSVPHLLVDFHEVFSLPRDFLELWVRLSGSNRLRLLPPYREHLSQAFARYFMRVGLPQDINL